ncbi:MAG: carbohydrate porin [Alphaproteobacteria bacterium]|nr:carbohydrate porin [Alphaproteobacteria bacterium]MDE2111391.1 carbohydrate porin [Alphaproteobacteria bacterium]MDE2495556.1 carbohydrate porin [Alphaproteobacteria bacterium]
MRAVLVIVAVASLVPGVALRAHGDVWSLHSQATFVWQYHPAFRSPYRGVNSLDPGSRGDETFDATLFAGVRLWDGGEFYADPEIDQGFGLSNTVGVAGFPSGEAYKVGKSEPYFRLQRLFFRQTFDLGGSMGVVDADANQIAGARTADNLVLTIGKFSVTDIFDANAYAHDPKQDFFNWAVIDSGAFDYAADAWGYSYGAAAEWTRSWWTLRAGLFDLSRVPNGAALETGLGQFEIVGELEGRYALGARPGALKLLGFVNRGRMGSYRDATALAAPDTALVRRYRSRPGVAINIAQQIDDGLGVFLRASANDGSQEAYEFTEINRSLTAGLSLSGDGWGRPGDTVGLAAVMNDISKAARAYLAAGGAGILIGDGALTHYRNEKILETYYRVGVADGLGLSLDYQWIGNPAYNGDRGPVSVIGLRLHAER